MRFEFEDPAGARHVLVTLGRPAAFRGVGLDFAAAATMFGRGWQVRCGGRAFPAVEAEEEHVDPAAPAGPALSAVS